ncbi:MAG: hypothetical protein PUF12_07790 [Thermoflexaceae bacterium]|nr:hypothetical protein [Thermoflexaceae bacterium]
MDNLKNNVRELLKNAVVLITLLAVTLILLEIPGRYYQKEDESLFNQIRIMDYSITSVDEKMSLLQEIESMSSDDCIVMVENEPYFTEEQLWEISANLVKEMREFLLYPWSETGPEILLSEFTKRMGMKVQIIRVINNKIYSCEIGMVQLYAAEDADEWIGSGIILFDMESYKILYLLLGCKYGYHSENFYDFGPDYDLLYAVNLKNYYEEAGILPENIKRDLGPDYISIASCDVDVSENSTLEELESIFLQYIDEKLQERSEGIGIEE